MFEIEIIEPKLTTCDCCGKPVTSLTRFVTKDERAWAVYKAVFAKNHPDRGVYLAIGLDEVGGPDWTGSTAFALNLSASETEFQTRVTDSSESPWRGTKALGRMLDRAEALAHPEIQEIFHLVDHIVREDPEIRELFETVH
jgi:hypothetical protein